MDLEDKGREIRRFPGSHLSAPLTYYPQRMVLNCYRSSANAPIKQIRDGVSLMKQVVKSIGPCEFTEDPSDIYHHCFSRCTVIKESVDPKSPLQDLRDMMISCMEEVKDSINCIKEHHPALADMKFSLDSKSLEPVIRNIYCAYQCYRFVSRIRGIMQTENVTGNRTSVLGGLKMGGLRVYVNYQLLVCALEGTPHNASLLNYEQWLMICDTVTARFLTLTCCELNHKRQFDVLPTPRLLRQIYRWGDEMIKEARMPGYAVIGEYESLVTSIFVNFAGSDPLGLGTNYVEAVMDSAKEIEDEYRVKYSWTVRLLDILKTVQSVNILSELFGIRKHWGNPMVDAQASGKAVQEKLDEDLQIDPAALLDLLSSFNRMITLSYIARHHQWPVCQFLDAPGRSSYPLKQAWSNNSMRVPERNIAHKHTDWALLRFGCNCVTDTYENQLAFLSDKSVSLPVEELDHVYIKGLKTNQPEGRSTGERRLILEFLRENQLSIMDILKIVMSDRMPESWFANSAAMKGTEVKYLKARIFAVLTLELRQYFAVTEDIIKNHIFPYNPHQTMTMTETELMAKLRDITKQMDVDKVCDTLNVMHIIDFSKWNLRMRYENTHMIFRSMDDFLGFPGLIEQSHIIFERMTNLVQDPYNPPDNPVSETNSDTIWRMHTRGWEGQRQKGWTVLTSALLSDLERISGVHSEICGQGDNQVLLSQFPIPQQYRNAKEWINAEPVEVKRVLDDYYEKLELKCAGVGLKVKTAESCRSLNYLNYGKRLFFRGAELSMTLKRISKAMTESNDSFPTSEIRLTTSQGASFAAGLFSHPSPWPYFMGRMCTMMILWESYVCNPLTGEYGLRVIESVNLSLFKFLSYLSKIPTCLGGPAQQPFTAFFCRGHPDPLCEELVMTCLRARQGCLIHHSILKSALDGYWFGTSSENEDRSSLILAPYALNVNRPRSTKTPVAQAVLPALIEFCKNNSVSSILSYDTGYYEGELFEALSTMTPFNPIVANDIFSRSIAGQRASFISGLKNATSICRLVNETADNPIIRQIVSLEKLQLHSWVMNVYHMVKIQGHVVNPVPNHHILAQQLRERSWGCQIIGVTVPHPIETFVLVAASDDVCSHHTPTSVPEHLVLVRHSDQLFAPVGSDSNKVQLIRSRTGRPYLGSHIAEGLTSKQIVCRNSTASWEDSCRLNILRHWVSDEGEQLNNLIEDIIRSRTDAKLSFLDMATGKPSRLSYSHRAALMATKKKCSITTTSNMFTRIYTSSNRMGRYSSGDLNFHLPYGPAYIVFGSLLCLSEVLGSRTGWNQERFSIYHCHLRTEDIPMVYDGSLFLPDRETVCRYKGTPPSLLFSRMNTMVFDDLTSGYSESDFLSHTEATLLDCKIAYGSVLIGDLFVKEISRRELMSSLIVNSYPRRTTPISVGDIKMTGVVGLVKAIAGGMLLVLGFERVMITNVNCLRCAATDFLQGFSSQFWSSFTTAMIQQDVVDKLVSMALQGHDDYDGASLSSLSAMFQSVVAGEICHLVFSLKRSIEHRKLSPLTIVAPNFSASRHLYAKYAEIAAWIVCQLAGKADEGKVNGKRMSQLVHQCKTIQECLLTARGELQRLSEDLMLDIIPQKVSNIKLLNTTDPWIDRLRNSVFIPGTLMSTQSEVIRNQNQLPQQHLEVHYLIGHSEIFSEMGDCKCPVEIIRPCLRTDGFFIRTGSLTVDPSCILDLLSRHELTYSKVVLLNDRSGAIGRAIAETTECEQIYICPCKPITEFDPHTAGTYIPPSFIGSSLRDKLIHASSAAMIGNPLHDKQSQVQFECQLSGIEWDGLVVSLPKEHSKSHTADVRTLIENLSLSICHIKTLNWVAIIGSHRCHHHLKCLLTMVSREFELLSVSTPVCTLPGQSKVIMVGKRRRNMSLNIGDWVSARQFLSDGRLADLLRRDYNRKLPQLMSEPESQQIAWLAHVAQKVTTITKACGIYLSGFGAMYGENLSISTVICDLQSYHSYLERAMAQVHKQRQELNVGRQSARSDILSLSVDQSQDQMERQAFELLKCEMLETLLSLQVGDIESAIQVVESMIRSKFTTTVVGTTYEFEFQTSSFYENCSFPLFCILGHLWKFGQISTKKESWQNIHVYHHLAVSHKQFEFPIVLPADSPLVPKEDVTYMWKSRAKLMSILMINVICGGEVVVSNKLKAISSLLQEHSNNMSLAIPLSSLDISTPLLIWVEEKDDFALLEEQVNNHVVSGGGVYVVATHDLIGVLTLMYEVEGFRVPWTGLTPAFVMVRIQSRRNPLLKMEEMRYINLSTTINSIYQQPSSTGCRCYDCVMEHFLINKTDVNLESLEYVCTPQGMEDLCDTFHLF